MADSVETFTNTATQLIQEALHYAAGGVYIAEVDANIRRIRAITAVLMSALNAASIPPSATGPGTEAT